MTGSGSGSSCPSWGGRRCDAALYLPLQQLLRLLQMLLLLQPLLLPMLLLRLH